MFNFLHTYSPQPIIFSLGPFNIYWYGLLIVIGILLGLGLTIKLGRRFGIKSDDILELAIWLIVFGLLGGRLYHVFLEFSYYLANPLAVFKVWQGGLAIHGVLLGGVITLIIWSRKKKYNFWQWADLLAPAIILGQAIGRWGNYFNQELYGWPTDSPWGIPIDLANRPIGETSQQFFQPTFLYESIADWLIFLFLLFIVIKIKPKPGKVFLLYLIFYSLARFIIEFYRMDSTPFFLVFRWPQVMSLAIIFLAFNIWLKLSLLTKKE